MFQKKQLQKILLSFPHLLFITLLKIHVVVGRFYPYQVSPGLFEDTVEDPIFYESFVPIVYEFKTPTWINSNITLRDWRGLCQTDDFAPSYTCPVFFYLERFIERIQAEVVPSVSSIPRMRPSLLNHTIVDKCERIQKHFPSSFTSNTSFDSYLSSFTSCPIQASVIKRGIPDYLYDIKTIYKKMVQKFENEFSARAGTGGITDRQGPSYYVNQITASQGIMLFNYWVEHKRWEDAKRDCAVQRIPSTLIKRQNLTQSLVKVDEEIKKQKYVLSIPLTETTTYYTSQLTDCTFTESTFAVRILVPVRQKSFNGKLVHLLPMPFIINDQEDNYSICQIYDVELKSYIYDNLEDYLVEAPHCERDGERGVANLCHVQNWSKTSLPNLCATAYFSKNPMNVKKYCRFLCEQRADGLFSKFPIFRRLSSDKYLITGNSDMEVIIKCEGARDQILNPVELGSLQVQLPCQCSLNYRSQVFRPEQPCEDGGAIENTNNNSSSIIAITPIHFFNFEFLEKSGLAVDYSPQGFNFSGILDPNMTDPRLFYIGGKIPAHPLASQLDVDSGLNELGDVHGGDNDDLDVQVMKYSSTTTTVSTTSVTWLWVLVTIQGIAFVCFILSVNKRLGMFSFPSKLYGGNGPLNNRRLSISTQNIIEAETNSRNNNPQDDSHFHL